MLFKGKLARRKKTVKKKHFLILMLQNSKDSVDCLNIMRADDKKIYLIVLSVAFASFLGRLNLYTVNVSLPTISRIFNIGTGEASRIVTVYLLVITSFLMFFGKLGDRTGHKNIFIIGYGVFILGSLFCGISTGINTLTIARAIHGLGSSMLLAASFAILARVVPENRLGWAFGMNASATALGVAAGAPLGGIIAEYLSWRGVFLINVPLGAGAMVCAYKFIPSSVGNHDAMPARIKRKFDFIGTILSFILLSALFFCNIIGSKQGWISFSTFALLGIFLLVLFFFITHEKKHEDPLLDINTLKSSKFTFALSATMMAYMLIAGNAFLLPFYLEIVKGLSPAGTGMILLVYSLIYVFVSPYAGKLSDRKNPAILCIAAMAAATINTFAFSYSIRNNGLIPVIVFLALFGFSYVFFLSPINNMAMSCASKGKEGMASGLLNTAINLSMVFGVAIFEKVFIDSLGSFAPGSVNLSQLDIPGSILLNGFSHAYVAGGMMCVLALFFTIFANKR
ncbi:MAG: MFS transporter [Proteobacteria bacterium]|nr:MFS transporter [Pseudomonadota bacterium]